MAQEGEDVRDYNLTEEQKAIKAKYPPVSRKYECQGTPKTVSSTTIQKHQFSRAQPLWSSAHIRPCVCIVAQSCRPFATPWTVVHHVPLHWDSPDLDHTADVQLHAWGDTLEEAFEQCAMAMFGYMTDTGTVEPLQTIEVETQGDDLQSLLFHFLDEWLYKFSADEFFIPREVKVLNIDQRNFKIRSIGWGEEFSLSKHPQDGCYSENGIG
ncbi:protein archease isoform X2 [Bubalus kerabau]|uniref:protein archease isoform X2 n=1 Tax=Bubalus carabanensis TaxID=3119969 RepID=UPI00244EF24A|nr:protein archease isoform X2 [Bubalus carabanensis]